MCETLPPYPLASGTQTLSCHTARVTPLGHAFHMCVPARFGLAGPVCSGGWSWFPLVCQLLGSPGVATRGDPP